MGLFNKKKEETNSCCCVGNCTPKTMAKTEASKSGVGVKVLGSGCVKCKTLEMLPMKLLWNWEWIQPSAM